MNPKGNHPVFPLLPNGKRDVDHDWPLKETWKQMEAVLKKGEINLFLTSAHLFVSVPTIRASQARSNQLGFLIFRRQSLKKSFLRQK